ncbi:MAG: hypothetical protein RI549_07290 [Wenzhouxiangella sp.]|nr:hypothetical protein [Wenzhouxiangella sp.]
MTQTITKPIAMKGTGTQRSFSRSGLISLALAWCVCSVAWADTASDDLNVKAGLIEALRLDCDVPMRFGITTVNALRQETGGDIEVQLNFGTVGVAGTSLSGGGKLELRNQPRVGISVSSGASASLGRCTMAGSAAAEDTEVDVTLNNTSLTLQSNAFGDLQAAETAANMVVSNIPFDPNKPLVNINGQAVFYIAGRLTIPGQLYRENLGGYGATMQVSVDDGFDETSTSQSTANFGY